MNVVRPHASAIRLNRHGPKVVASCRETSPSQYAFAPRVASPEPVPPTHHQNGTLREAKTVFTMLSNKYEKNSARCVIGVFFVAPREPPVRGHVFAAREPLARDMCLQPLARDMCLPRAALINDASKKLASGATDDETYTNSNIESPAQRPTA
jgi:hypothetical protein